MKTRPDRPTLARTQAHCPCPCPRPRPPLAQARHPLSVVALNQRGLVAIDKDSYRSWRSPSGRPAPAFIGAHIGLGREESSAGWGSQGSRASLCPALPASAAGPIVSAIWPAKAALPPRPPPLPRLKLINGSAYRRRHRLLALSARHIYLCAEQKAHRGAGSCAPALARERGTAAPRAQPTRGLVAGEASVAGAQLRGPHAQPRAEGRRTGAAAW